MFFLTFLSLNIIHSCSLAGCGISENSFWHKCEAHLGSLCTHRLFASDQHQHNFHMRVLLLVDYTNFDDVGKQNSNGKIEQNKMLVGFIIVYMSVVTTQVLGRSR